LVERRSPKPYRSGVRDSPPLGDNIKMLSKFFSEVKNELDKISWIDKRENIKSTAGVVIVTIVLGIILLVIDLIFSKLTEFFLGGS
tara:strand:+ start:191 stop:448 length:258 start_codon:yes stop_codon:yes gene_type:complete